MLRVAKALHCVAGTLALLLAGCDAQNQLSDAVAGRAVPQVASAKALSQHYVEVAFTEPAGAEATNAARYIVTDPQNRPLPVSGVEKTADPTRVLLITEPQQLVNYGLRVDRSPTPTTGDVEAQLSPEVQFAGENGPEPCILYAIALSNTQILITFDLSMEAATVNNKSYYEIQPDLAITSVLLDNNNPKTAVINTAAQENIDYTLRVTNVRSGASSYYLVDPVCNEATFNGIPLTDNTPPCVKSVVATDPGTILVSFSEPIGNNAADPTKYTITPALTITGAQLNMFNTQVKLTTLPMQAGINYTLAVTGIKDYANNSIGAANVAACNGAAANLAVVVNPNEEGDEDVLPRIVGAVSTSNTTVLLAYNKPMGDSAINVNNYRIEQENIEAEASILEIFGVQFDDSSKMAVKLTTYSQAEATYRATAVNVRDQFGNQLAPKTILSDPSSTTFAGVGFSCPFATCAAGSAVPVGTRCNSDDDCDNDKPCNNGELDCKGKCVEPQCKLPDADDDGLTDVEELRGWSITVRLQQGQQRGEGDPILYERQVTSDVFSADTDNDGLDDLLERQLISDPRSPDTDFDQLSDYDEYNVYYSDWIDQDTDGDGMFDGLEVDLFKTGPIFRDSDGDGFADGDELFQLERNPLIADLPLPQVTVGELALELGITYSYSEEGETTTSEERTTSATFTQSRTNTLGTSDTTSMEAENTFGQKIGTEIGQDEGGLTNPVSWKVSAEVSFGQSMARGYSTTVDRQTAETSQSEYQDSVTEGLQFSERRAVSRNIESAIIQATVNIGNQSDLAFSITNIELSLLLQDRAAGLDFTPIATLRPTGADNPTEQPVFNLGPLDRERGPIIFESTTVFPNRVEALLREPTGLLVKVVNFDVLDEAGRNLVFTSQDVSDRTVGITIDYGNGTVESYRVATTSTFDSNGKPRGINMQRALEIIGLTQSATPGPNSYVVETVTRSACAPLSTSIEAPKSIRGLANNGTIATWVALVTETNAELNCVNFTSIPLYAHGSFTLKYAYDVDNDDLLRGEEYLYGSSDEDTDSDDDTIGDLEEVRTGWLVSKTPGIPYKAFPSPARPDSDLDGLNDKAEKAAGTDPNRADTDEDALSDESELTDTYTIRMADRDLNPANNPVLTVAPYSDWAITAGPNLTCNTVAPSGDDTIVTQSGPGSKLCVASGPDGVISTLPSIDDKVVATAKVDPGPDGKCQTTSASGDDVVEFSDANNPPVKGSIGKVCISAGLNDTLDTTSPLGDDFVRAVHKGLFGTNPVAQDTDLDGLPDGRELLLKTNPNAKDAGKVIDTDKDGLVDQEEEDGWDVVVGNTTRHVNSDKNFPDTDNDGIPDVIENAIRTDPRDLDTDDDTLLDYNEFDKANLGWTLANGNVDKYPTEALATALGRCVAPNCIYVQPSADELYSTHPSRKDSDLDGREDDDEAVVGWDVVATTPTGQASHPGVKSNPLHADEDGDRLPDAVEFTKKSLPDNEDTDQDGTFDGDEVVTCNDTNPNTADCRDLLFADRLLVFTYTSFQTFSDCDDSPDDGSELESSETNELGLTYPGVSQQTFDIPGFLETCNGEASTIASSVELLYPRTFLLKSGESFTASSRGTWNECDAGVPGRDPLSAFSVAKSYSDVASVAPNTAASYFGQVTNTGTTEGSCEFRIHFTVANLVLAPDGGACSTADDCRVANFCVDGVCCNEACNTTCKACNLAASMGTCTNIAAGQDPDNECPGTCNGSGACQP